MAPVLFRTVRVANVREKLFSSAAAEKLSKEQRDGLEAVLETIGTDEYATREISPGQVELLNNLMTFWDQEELAPGMLPLFLYCSSGRGGDSAHVCCVGRAPCTPLILALLASSTNPGAVMDVFRCVILFEGAHSSNFVEDAV